MNISSCLFVTFVGLMGWPDVPWRAELNRELAKICGTWVVEIADSDSPFLEEGSRINFGTGGRVKWTIKSGGEEEWLNGSGCYLDIRTKPKQLVIGMGIGGFFGIYEFDSDRLHFCFTYKGQGTVPGQKTIPTQFKADRERDHNLVILKRVKP